MERNPSDIVYNPDNKLLYIINKHIFNYIRVINPINGDLIEKVIIGLKANDILYNPNNQMMYNEGWSSRYNSNEYFKYW